MGQPRRATCLLYVGRDRQPSFVVEHCRLPTLNDLQLGELLVKIRLAGLCNSDIEVFTGHRKDVEQIAPSILGHEAVGEVVISRRAGFQAGTRVVFSVDDWCGSCDWCQRGMQVACSSVVKYGRGTVSDGNGLNGSCSSHIHIRAGTKLVAVPASVPDEAAVLANCSLSTVMCGVYKALQKTPLGSKTALVQGTGLLGVLACAVLHEEGFHVFCTDPNVNGLHMAARFGAQPVANQPGPLHLNPPPEEVDVVVKACWSSDVVPLGLRALRPGGTYLMLGPTETVTLPEQMAAHNFSILGVSSYLPHQLEQAVDFLRNTVHKFPYSDLLSPAYNLSEFQTALSVANTRKYYRVVIKPPT